jgi:hypothetical protein
MFLVSAASKAAAARPAIWLGSSFIDSEGAAGHFSSVQVSHGFGRLIVLGHFEKGEPARLAGFAVVSDVDTCDLAKRFE